MNDAFKKVMFDKMLTAWKVCKYGVISGPYFSIFGLNTGKYGPEITPYLETFHAVVETDTSLFPTLTIFFIIYFLFCNFPFPDTFINYLVSGVVYFLVYMYVFSCYHHYIEKN